MAEILLVKHSLPEIDPQRPAAEWHLGEEGRRRCQALAACLAPYAPTRLVASLEPKATETARSTAAGLQRPVETRPGLHEHLRQQVAFQTREVFEAQVAEFFARPSDLVFGEETADQAHRRFAAAIHRLLEEVPEETLAVVTHGTVLSLFVARACGLEPFDLWKRLGLPSFVVLTRPDFQLKTIVENVEF